VSRWQPEAIGMGVTATHAALAWRAPARSAGQTALSWTCWPLNGAVDSPSLSALPAGPLRITLDDALVHHWVIHAPEGTASLRELRSYAALRFETLFGESAGDWEIEGDWKASGPMVCQAVPKDLARRLQETSALIKRPIADRLACASRLQKLNREATTETKAKPQTNVVWVAVGLAHCTLWWLSSGQATRVTTLRTETHNPWCRVVQEIQRADAQRSDAATTTEVHWASLQACAEPAHPTMRFVQHRDPQAIRFAPPLLDDASASAVLLASRGCV
jgi:hypothetical protein